MAIDVYAVQDTDLVTYQHPDSQDVRCRHELQRDDIDERGQRTTNDREHWMWPPPVQKIEAGLSS